MLPSKPGGPTLVKRPGPRLDLNKPQMVHHERYHDTKECADLKGRTPHAHTIRQTDHSNLGNHSQTTTMNRHRPPRKTPGRKIEISRKVEHHMLTKNDRLITAPWEPIRSRPPWIDIDPPGKLRDERSNFPAPGDPTSLHWHTLITTSNMQPAT